MCTNNIWPERVITTSMFTVLSPEGWLNDETVKRVIGAFAPDLHDNFTNPYLLRTGVRVLALFYLGRDSFGIGNAIVLTVTNERTPAGAQYIRLSVGSLGSSPFGQVREISPERAAQQLNGFEEKIRAIFS